MAILGKPAVHLDHTRSRLDRLFKSQARVLRIGAGRAPVGNFDKVGHHHRNQGIMIG